MKKTFLPAICILLCTLFIAIIPTEAEAAIYEDTVRLHILAESDQSDDQNIKIIIRDKLLEKYSSLLNTAKSSNEAREKLEEALPMIEEDCNAWISDTGADYIAKVSLCEEWYNTREYESFTLPAGNYTSLKIILGKGMGQNWWCVMYPPLCLDAAICDVDFSKEEYFLISQTGYNVKFKLLEVTSAVFEKRK